MLESLRNKRIMVVVAHPDDELLGLGATLHKLINEYNVTTHVVILGEGITARSDKRDVKEWESELKIHRSNINNAQKATVALLDIIKVVEKEKEMFKPDVIFTHHGGDVNIDHQRTFESVITCCRPMKNEMVKTIIAFETPSGTEWRASSDPRHFVPNFFISISEQNVNAKIKGMESYEFERREYPHPRSQEALVIQAKRWGVVVGSDFVEAFCIIRSIN